MLVKGIITENLGAPQELVVVPPVIIFVFSSNQFKEFHRFMEYSNRLESPNNCMICI